eukprot:gnl/TRDRNA2_/TRDRNA2_213118_c0_seq1.p1 gnl/TRDRNA2_/TRDRNA2_213118_c0~~gnl/TRDRNA2_/TRDRNA2_213118_c0_seq1.p1  ORF type:complete len:107 (-),score=5.75 gnl/TRDRNA2_/TRDRNA2_213118_c0_seq1:5-325(-)
MKLRQNVAASYLLARLQQTFCGLRMRPRETTALSLESWFTCLGFIPVPNIVLRDPPFEHELSPVRGRLQAPQRMYVGHARGHDLWLWATLHKTFSKLRVRPTTLHF